MSTATKQLPCVDDYVRAHRTGPNDRGTRQFLIERAKQDGRSASTYYNVYRGSFRRRPRGMLAYLWDLFEAEGREWLCDRTKTIAREESEARKAASQKAA